MNFEQAIDIILKLEGGYVAHPNDPGGDTNYGISQRSYPKLNIQLLSREIAKDIYKRDYWDDLRLDDFHPKLRLIMFDSAINQGKNRAIKIIQGLLKQKMDGVLGPITFAAMKTVNPHTLFEQFALMRHDYYSQSGIWASFGKGWSKRLLTIVLESCAID